MKRIITILLLLAATTQAGLMEQVWARRGVVSSAATPWYLAGGVVSSNCVGAWQAKGATSLSNAYVNLANPGTYNLSEGTAPTWNSATGFVFNGSSQYLKTGIIPSGTSTFIVMFSGGSTTGTRCVMGFGNNVSGFMRCFSVLGGASPYIGFGLTAWNTGSAITSGTMAVNSSGAYTNGVAAASWSASSSAFLEVYLAAQNVNGSPNSYFAGNVKCAAMYNFVLTTNQIYAISQAMAGL